MKEKIVDALLKLDTSNDNQWTQDGLPKIEILKFLMGGEVITREQINEAAPGFTRSNPIIGDGSNGESNEVVAQQSAEGEQGQEPTQEQGSQEQASEGDGAGLAGEQKASQSETSVVTHVTPMTVGVNVTFADVLKAVLTELAFTDVKELEDEDLQELAARHSDILSADNQFLSEVNEFVTKRALYLSKVVEELAKREPQQSQADVLAQFHESMFRNQQNLPINKPRQVQARGPVYFGK